MDRDIERDRDIDRCRKGRETWTEIEKETET